MSNTLDRKAANLYLGCGGAYCDLCDLSKEQCNNVETVENGFVINREVKNMKDIFEALVQEDGTIKKSAQDYNIRQGQTTKPIVEHQAPSVQVLHAVLIIL